jgi:lysophospholipase L1-like esterase
LPSKPTRFHDAIIANRLSCRKTSDAENSSGGRATAAYERRTTMITRRPCLKRSMFAQSRLMTSVIVALGFHQVAAFGGPPAHLLFIGDSLTDQQRGYNYVDKLAFWLQRSHGSELTYRNAGVGGDFISRVWQRMNGDPGAYRVSMYDDLFEPKPTHVFFFLGHNDSKVSSLSGYTRHCVDPHTFEEQYRLAIRKVQNQTGAKVIVISATSSVFEICRANADKRQAAGKPHNLFGKPEELEKFNAVAKRIAAELGAGYVDVYEPTRSHPDKRSLFNPNDGVHLTNAGNRFIAYEVLEYLGRK